MGQQEYNDLESLLFSQSFRDWALGGDPPEAGFWERWQTLHPDRPALVQHARAVIYALQLHSKVLSGEEIEEEMGKTLQRLQETGLTRALPTPPATGHPLSRMLSGFSSPGPRGFSRRPGLAWTLAACVAVLCILIWSITVYSHRHHLHEVHKVPAVKH